MTPSLNIVPGAKFLSCYQNSPPIPKTGFMVLYSNIGREHRIDVAPEKGHEYQAVCIFVKGNREKPLTLSDPGYPDQS
jgi:hypothetical protein